MCVLTVIAASLAISWDSSSFSSDCSDRVPKRYRKGEGIEASISLSMCDEYFSLHKQYFANPNGEDVRKWISKHISKFHNNPTFNESGIVVLLRQYWVSAGKEKVAIKKVLSLLRLIFVISNGENIWNLVSNRVLKYHDDPTVNKSEIIVFLRQVWWYSKKERILGRGEGKTNLRGRWGIVSVKTDLTRLYL